MNGEKGGSSKMGRVEGYFRKSSKINYIKIVLVLKMS
jgi:hypothetical protein